LFEKESADEADDGIVIWEDSDDLGSSLDLAVDALDGVDNRYEMTGASIPAVGPSV